MRFRCFILFGWALAIGATAPAQLDDPPDAAQRYREREVFDPNLGDWVTLTPASAPAPDELSEARQALARGDTRLARKLLEAWVKSNDASAQSAEARFLLGETYFEEGDYYAAYEQYDQAVEGAAGDLFFRLLQREMDVARAFLSGRPRIFWGFLKIPAVDDAFEILDGVWARAPGTRLAEEALKLKADARFARGEFELAQDEYSFLAQQYPNGRYAQAALLRAAESAQAAFPGVAFDEQPLRLAQDRYRQIEDLYPLVAEREGVTQRLDSIREQRAEKDLEIARYYERAAQSGAAEYYYRLVLRDWDGTLAASRARQRLTALGVALTPQESAAPERDQERDADRVGGDGDSPDAPPPI